MVACSSRMHCLQYYTLVPDNLSSILLCPSFVVSLGILKIIICIVKTCKQTFLASVCSEKKFRKKEEKNWVGKIRTWALSLEDPELKRGSWV